jgi:AcrR family transcriptional regulator
MTDATTKQLWRPGPAEAGRDAVLKAAAEEFVKHGFTATSMDGIADALGSTKGRVYHYYRGKAEIFLDVVLHGMQDLLLMIEPIASDHEAAAPERLGRMVRSHATCMMEASDPQRVAVQLVQYRGMPELATHQETTERIIELRRRYEQAFIDVIREGIADGTLLDVDASLAAKSLLGSLNWIPMWFRPGRSSGEEVARIADFFSESALRSLETKGA